MKIKVCSVGDATQLLNTDNHGIDVVISILDPGAFDRLRPPGLDKIKYLLEIQFDDCEQPHAVFMHPTLEDAQTIVDFILATKSKVEADSWLIHCHMGKSRSAACGLLLCALIYGIDNAREELLKIAPQASPNTLMCQYFDDICGFGGKLAKLSWDFDYQLLKKLSQNYFETEGEGP